jgi:hypothetical protein
VTSGRSVLALAVYDGGNGADLYAGGDFVLSSGANRIARWNGSSWSALGTGTNATVDALAVFEAVAGTEHLFVGGDFGIAGPVSVGGLARWNGSGWSFVRGGPGRRVQALHAFPETLELGRGLYVGGSFDVEPNHGDSQLALWLGCPDKTPPQIHCPDSIVVDDVGTPGERVQFIVTARDDLDETVRVRSTPFSGSLFPPGTTVVIAKTVDNAGNVATCEFRVTVRRPAGK